MEFIFTNGDIEALVNAGNPMLAKNSMPELTQEEVAFRNDPIITFSYIRVSEIDFV